MIPKINNAADEGKLSQLYSDASSTSLDLLQPRPKKKRAKADDEDSLTNFNIDDYGEETSDVEDVELLFSSRKKNFIDDLPSDSD